MSWYCEEGSSVSPSLYCPILKNGRINLVTLSLFYNWLTSTLPRVNSAIPHFPCCASSWLCRNSLQHSSENAIPHLPTCNKPATYITVANPGEKAWCRCKGKNHTHHEYKTNEPHQCTEWYHKFIQPRLLVQRQLLEASDAPSGTTRCTFRQEWCVVKK